MRKYLCILTVLILAACTPQLPDSPETLVVEGWIENDAAPMVFITSSISATFREQGITDLIGHLATTATASITCDGVKYPLTPAINDDYVLPLCYTSNTLKGVTGSTYLLQVDWKGMHAEATTTIPAPAGIDSIAVEHHPYDDTLYIVKAHIVPAPGVRYYRFFSMTAGRDSTYGPSYIGTFDSQLHADEMAAVNRSTQNPIRYDGHYHCMGDSVLFKLASIDSTAYQFWNAFDESGIFSHAALIPYSSNLKGNLTGALGYFFGYGISPYAVTIKK